MGNDEARFVRLQQRILVGFEKMQRFIGIEEHAVRGANSHQEPNQEDYRGGEVGVCLEPVLERIEWSSCCTFQAHNPLGSRMNPYRGSGSGRSASAYPMTAMAAAFSRSSWGTILSSVSAAVW